MSHFIKSYKKLLLDNFFHIPVWFLRIIFPTKRLKIRGTKIDLQSFTFIKLNPKSTLYKIHEKDLPKIRKVVESNKINSYLSARPRNPVETIDHCIYSDTRRDEMLLREYIPKKVESDKIILFFHGGGWTIDSVETYDDMVKYFSDYLNLKIYSLEYSLAPEKKFPFAIEEAEEAYKWLINNVASSNKISLCGDSAGGHMAASLSYKISKQDLALPNSMLLIYPPCDPGFTQESIKLYKDEYFLLHSDLVWFWNKLKENEKNQYDPMFNLLKFDLKSKLPPAIVVTAGFDPICDEGGEYANLLCKQGNSIKILNYPTLFHNFAFMTKLNAAKKAVNNFLDEYKKIV